jgi:hypothetical protein
MKSAAIHGLLAVAGLLAAYQTWTRGDDEQVPPPGEATVVQCQPGDLVSFAMKGKTRNVTIEPRKLQGEDGYWITVEHITRKPAAAQKKPAEEKPEAKKAEEKKPEQESKGPQKPGEEKPAAAEAASDDKSPQAKPPAEPEKPEPEVKITRKAFLGNQAVDEYMKWIAPFRAVRAIGPANDEQLKSFGLQKDEIDTTLELACGKQSEKIEVGAWTYGRGDRYARLAGSKEIFLIPSAVVKDLQSAGYKFMRKKLHGFELRDVDQARVVALDTERKLLHRDRKVPASAMWVDAAAPDRRNRLFDNWFSQVNRLQAFSYLEPGAQPGSDLDQQSGEVEQLLTIEYRQAGKKLDSLQLVRVTADKKYYYVQTDHTHGWVRVSSSLAERISRDAALVVGKEEPPEDQEPPDRPEKKTAPPGDVPN